jgi:large subunit ribosomal protein L3
MTRFFDGEGAHVPVTVLALDGCQVVGHRTQRRDGYTALQLGAGVKAPKNVARPQRAEFAEALVDVKAVRREFRVPEDALLEIGSVLSADHFVPGQLVDVRGVSIGKGMAGAMKRWNFGGMRATHGVSVSHRAHGSTGQRQDPGKVFKGKKMAGHLGVETVTTQNLTVFRVDAERGLIMIKGAVPGSKQGWVEVRDAVRRPVPPTAPFPGAIRNTRTATTGPGDDPSTPLSDYLDAMQTAWAKVLGDPDGRRDGVYDLYRHLWSLLARGRRDEEAVDGNLAVALNNIPATATRLVLDEDRGVAQAGALLLALLLEGPRPELRLGNEDEWGPDLTAAVGSAIREHVRTLPIRFVTRESLKRSSHDGRTRVGGRLEVLTVLPGLELDGPVATAAPEWAVEDAAAALTLAWTVEGEPLPFKAAVERLSPTLADRRVGVLAAFSICAEADAGEPLDDTTLRLRPSIAGRPLSPLYVRVADMPEG